jgi:D-tyrosyl-tRNA(Tyr) deacylase
LCRHRATHEACFPAIVVRRKLALCAIREAPLIALIQRVSSAQVEVAGETVGAIGTGLLALVAVQPDDGEAQTRRMLERLLGYRMFADDAGRMNRSLADIGGGLLLVSQFTLAADTDSGMRPSFTRAAPPEHARQWFDRLVMLARAAHPGVETGRFGAHMEVRLVNDGPVTFWLEVP